MRNIRIEDAYEGNLKHITLEIPRNQLIVLTGLSGSGKTTLAMDVLFNECQRQYLEAITLQGIRKPNVHAIRNISPAILITQNSANKNPRSSIGTSTDIYTDLRMLYEKLGKRNCPFCKKEVYPYDCREEVKKKGQEYFVYQYCRHCNERFPKITRTNFSFNTKEGACPTCEGLGHVVRIHHQNTVHEDMCIQDGAIAFWEKKYTEYQISIFEKALKHYQIDVELHKAISSYPKTAKTLLLYGISSPEFLSMFPNMTPPKNVSDGRFEGVYPMLWRKLKERDGDMKGLSQYFTYDTCPSCKGERLNEESRNVEVYHKRLPQVASLSLAELQLWIKDITASLTPKEYEVVSDYLKDIQTKVTRICNVGLSYLTLDRQSVTLSGGETQRLKLAATLDSDLTGIIYILDEPTIGLHPQDTKGILTILKQLRDLGNTVIVIEHDIDIMKQADHIIDIGPGAGIFGGEVIAQGSYQELIENPLSITGQYLKQNHIQVHKPRTSQTLPILVEHANLHNLKDVFLQIPTNVLVTFTGVSGSGKSTLLFDLIEHYKDYAYGQDNLVKNMDQFSKIIAIHQSPLTKMSRSNVATYCGVYTHIRDVFAKLETAKNSNLNAKYFSFNTKGGRCEHCEGMGYVISNMLFFQDVKQVCPVCNGKQFQEDILTITYQKKSIKDVLDTSIDDAIILFSQHPKIIQILQILQECGLGYITLGQSLTTLSGGEGQRLKLASELYTNKKANQLYLIDEPTTGLHPIDVHHFLLLLQRMVEQGNTVLVIEHNTQVIQASDWIIDLGPKGGIEGGEIIAQGTPITVKENPYSITGKYL